MKKKYKIAIVGATGAVGEEIIRVLEEEQFLAETILPLASSKSSGKTIEAFGKQIPVQTTTHEIFQKYKADIVFFSAGGNVSKEFALSAAKSGAVVIDNTSYFRMQKEVPLVVPEVNPQDIRHWHTTGIIANPNCSTIQMVQVLHPLQQAFGIKRVDVSTYQAVSGAGKRGMEELFTQMQKVCSFNFNACTPEVFPHRIAINVIPHIDVFLDDGSTKEEWKMTAETKKILDPKIKVHANCARVPVFVGHAEYVNIETQKEISDKEATFILKKTPGVTVLDTRELGGYPTQAEIAGEDDVFVSRIRSDSTVDNGLSFWCVADNLRKGAALNAVQIAEVLLKD